MMPEGIEQNTGLQAVVPPHSDPCHKLQAETHGNIEGFFFLFFSFFCFFSPSYLFFNVVKTDLENKYI